MRIQDFEFAEFWANGALGTVSSPPPEFVALADGWRGHVRWVPTTRGVRPYYWVSLDEARLDGDGDGPYLEAEIAEAALHPLVES